MKIFVGAHLNAYTPDNCSSFEFDFSEQTTLFKVLEMINIPQAEAQMNLVFINNRALAPVRDTVLDNDDQVIIYPPISGG